MTRDEQIQLTINSFVSEGKEFTPEQAKFVHKLITRYHAFDDSHAGRHYDQGYSPSTGPPKQASRTPEVQQKHVGKMKKQLGMR